MVITITSTSTVNFFLFQHLYYKFFSSKRIIYLLALTDLVFPLLKLIRKGDIDAALGKLGEWYPEIVQVNNLNVKAINAKCSLCFL